MRIGVVLSPVREWASIVDAARLADDAGLDAIGFSDHYQSLRPEWGYICGWSAYGYLAAVTKRVRLVPMVINNLHYEPGVLAKETSMLSIASGGRFELGIGSGDWPESFSAWGRPYPDPRSRLSQLEETVLALRQLWKGARVTISGEHVRLKDAICTPVSESPPSIVVGVGGSRSTLREGIRFADELNVYADPNFVDIAQAEVARSGRTIGLSIYLGWQDEEWPEDPGAELRRWHARGIDRCFVSAGGPDLEHRILALADAAGSLR